jgi:hypothetical protein
MARLMDSELTTTVLIPEGAEQDPAEVILRETEQRVDCTLIMRYTEGDAAALESLGERYAELIDLANEILGTDERGVPRGTRLFEQAVRTYRPQPSLTFSEWASRVLTRSLENAQKVEVPSPDIGELVTELASIGGIAKIRHMQKIPQADKVAAMEHEIEYRPLFAEKLAKEEWYQTARDSVRRAMLRHLVLRLGEISRMSAVHEIDGQTHPMREFEPERMLRVIECLYALESEELSASSFTDEHTPKRAVAASPPGHEGEKAELLIPSADTIPQLTRNGVEIAETTHSVMPMLIGYFRKHNRAPRGRDLLSVNGREEFRDAHMIVMTALLDHGVIDFSELASLSERAHAAVALHDVAQFRAQVETDEHLRFSLSFNAERINEFIAVLSPEVVRESLQEYAKDKLKIQPDLQKAYQAREYADSLLYLVRNGLESTRGKPTAAERDTLINEVTPLLAWIAAGIDKNGCTAEPGQTAYLEKRVGKLMRLAFRAARSNHPHLAAAREFLPYSFPSLNQHQRFIVYRAFVKQACRELRERPLHREANEAFATAVEQLVS